MKQIIIAVCCVLLASSSFADQGTTVSGNASASGVKNDNFGSKNAGISSHSGDSNSNTGDITVENSSTLTNALQMNYEQRGLKAEKAGRSEDALWFYARAASLSLDVMHLEGGHSPKYCGMVGHDGKMNSYRETVCANTQSLCQKVIELKVNAAFRNSATTSTLQTDCGLKF